MPAGLARNLWEENADLAQANLACRFVRGLGEGSLPRTAFQAYIAQDACFLEAFARAYALAAAHSADRATLAAFAELLAGVLKELELHASYAAKWQVDLEGVAPHPATRAYTDFLLAAARDTVGATCAAMAPCMRLYAFLGQGLHREFPDAAHTYADWIATYADPGFDDLAGQLESLLDRHADDTPAIHALYRRAMQLELAFFNAHA